MHRGGKEYTSSTAAGVTTGAGLPAIQQPSHPTLPPPGDDSSTRSWRRNKTTKRHTEHRLQTGSHRRACPQPPSPHAGDDRIETVGRSSDRISRFGSLACRNLPCRILNDHGPDGRSRARPSTLERTTQYSASLKAASGRAGTGSVTRDPDAEDPHPFEKSFEVSFAGRVPGEVESGARICV